MRKLFILSVFCFFALAGLEGALAQIVEQEKPASTNGLIASAQTQTERYRIGYQDVIQIQVFNHSELNKTVTVGPDGTIMLNRLDKPVTALCKTERELEEDIAEAFKAKFIRDPRVSVFVADQKSQPIAVIGAVEKPGTYYVNRRYHLLEILAMAGGPNKESGTRLMVARTGSASSCKQASDVSDDDKIKVMDFKLREVLDGKKTLWMQPGDVVSVLDADVVYVYGEVVKQGSYRVREAITLTQAIVTAEGLSPTAKRGNVRVLRQKPGSDEREELTFDLNQIDRGKTKDPMLLPNDIVAVSQDKVKTILKGVTGMIKNTIPNAIYRLP